MEITGRIARQTLLLSLIIVIIPMVVFPERFGLNLAHMTFMSVVYELLFYSVVLFFFNRHATLLQLARSVGLCFVFRLANGAFFGLLLTAVYSMNIKISLMLGMSGYLPALYMHVLATPFILKPLHYQIHLPERQRKVVAPEKSIDPSIDTGTTTFAISKDKSLSQTTTPMVHKPEMPEKMHLPTSEVKPSTAIADTNGFDRATAYIGENGSVQLAMVVDAEGLLLSQFSRGDVVAEDWAPFALIFKDNNRQVADRLGWDVPEKIDLLLKDNKVIIACDGMVNLMVIAERQSDDVLNIRINQGLEIIRKYIAERYGDDQVMKTERSYVSST